MCFVAGAVLVCPLGPGTAAASEQPSSFSGPWLGTGTSLIPEVSGLWLGGQMRPMAMSTSKPYTKIAINCVSNVSNYSPLNVKGVGATRNRTYGTSFVVCVRATQSCMRW